MTLGKQKATNVVRQVLGFYSIQECVAKLKANKFSLIVDETTDNSTTSQLAVLEVYFDEKDFRLEIILIDLIPLKDGTATTIYTSLLESLRERGIPMQNVVGFCADTCNVMFGVNHSVSQLLVKDYPWIIAVKCSCHLIHLCSSYAAKTLPKSVEDLCRNIFSHFSLSSKRSEAFKEFQQFVEIKELKILQPGEQRKYCTVCTKHAILVVDYICFLISCEFLILGYTWWLSMKSCVKRILENYNALKLYFTSVAFEDPTHTNDAILASLNNKFIEAYLEFMDYNLGRFVSFNLLFQSEMPQLHLLKSEVDKLIMSLCLHFMEMAYVRGTEAFKIDPTMKEKQLSLSQVYIGILASDTMHSIKAELGQDNPDIPLFFSQCREFLIEAVKQIQTRFDDCNKLDVMSCLSPDVAYDLKISSFEALYKKMPLLAQVADLQKVDQEWREHSLNPKLNGDMSVQGYWQVVFKEKKTPDKLATPNLVQVLLSLPFSNAAVERVFSQLKLVKNDHRANLKQESLLGLLTTKMSLLKSSSSKESQTVKLQLTREMFDLYRGMKSNADNDEVTELRKAFIEKLKM